MRQLILDKLLSLFYNEKCIFCGKKPLNHKYYCKECYEKLPYITGKSCLICGRQMYQDEGGYKICPSCSKQKMHFDANFPVFIYDGIIKDALRRYKFTNQMWYYKAFGEFMAKRLMEENINIDFILYPPVNNKTFYERGYTQTELLSEVVAKKIKKPLLKNAIIKIRQNEKQSLMSASRRAGNVRNAFKVNEKFIKDIEGKNVLFVDDILTTGATMNECAKILKKKGVMRVYGLTLCATR